MGDLHWSLSVPCWNSQSDQMTEQEVIRCCGGPKWASSGYFQRNFGPSVKSLMGLVRYVMQVLSFRLVLRADR